MTDAEAIRACARELMIAAKDDGTVKAVMKKLIELANKMESRTENPKYEPW